MKTRLTCLLLAALLCGSPAWAQCTDGLDEICIFWSADCVECQNCENSPGTPITAYIILINASHTAGVIGFEFMLVNGDGSAFPPSQVEVLGYQLPPAAINVEIPPEFVVGLAAALPWNSCMTLLTVEVMPLGDDPWCFGVQPPPEGSFPTSMAYAAATDPIEILPMYPCTGDDGFRIACLNEPGCPPPVGNETAVWGSIKGLFR
jgi:hypothetical protein